MLHGGWMTGFHLGTLATKQRHLLDTQHSNWWSWYHGITFIDGCWGVDTSGAQWPEEEKWHCCRNDLILSHLTKAIASWLLNVFAFTLVTLAVFRKVSQSNWAKTLKLQQHRFVLASRWILHDMSSLSSQQTQTHQHKRIGQLMTDDDIYGCFQNRGTPKMDGL